MKKILTAALSCVLAVTGCAAMFAGCNTTRDANTLEIRYYIGGFGNEWIEAAAAAFEEENPGVTVKLIGDNDVTTSVTTYLSSGRQLSDIYFTQSVDWQYYVSQGWIEPLDDLYNNENNAYPIELSDGSTTTLYDFMIDERKDVPYMPIRPGQTTSHAWIIPWSVQNCGMVYNETIVLNTPHRSSCEHSGNWDHVPTTMSELYEYVADLNAAQLKTSDLNPDRPDDDTVIAPFAFGIQQGQWWLTFPLKVWWAQYQGVYETSQAARNDGHAVDAKTDDPDEEVYDSYYDFWDFGAPTYNVDEFTAENGTNVWNQKGIQVALDTLASLISDGNGNYINCIANADEISGEMAERAFAYGQSAFIFVGNWIENEMRDFMSDSVSMKAMAVPFLDGSTTDAEGDPIPSQSVATAATDENGDPYLVNNNAEMDVIFIPSEAPNKELAKQFLAFIHSEDWLLDFTKRTGVQRPFNYDPLDAEDDTFRYSDFVKSSLELYETADFNITEYPMNKGHVSEEEQATYISWIFTYERPELFQGTGSGPCLNGILTKSGAEIMADVIEETNRQYKIWVDDLGISDLI